MMDQVQKYVFPSIFNPVSHTLLNSVLWPVLSKQFSSRPERQSSARPPRLQASQWHPRVAKHSSDRSSARRPLPEVPQWHPRVAKGASIGTLARRPCPQVPQGHPRVAKGVFRPIFGTATPSRGTSETSPRGEEGFYRHFGTATLPTDASVASSRGKAFF